MRPLLLVCGWVMLAFGFLGTVLPGLPATPFLLAAAWLFSRSSPRLQQWLHDLPAIGTSLRLWQEHHAIGLKAKCAALAGMALGAWFLLGRVEIPAALTWTLLAIMIAVAVFIITRPGSPRRSIQ